MNYTSRKISEVQAECYWNILWRYNKEGLRRVISRKEGGLVRILVNIMAAVIAAVKYSSR